MRVLWVLMMRGRHAQEGLVGVCKYVRPSNFDVDGDVVDKQVDFVVVLDFASCGDLYVLVTLVTLRRWIWASRASVLVQCWREDAEA